MSFFHNEVKAKTPARTSAPKSLKDMPISVMSEIGCKICPKNESTHPDGAKLSPSGNLSPDVYLLFSSPSMADGFPDPKNPRVEDKEMDVVLSKMPQSLRVRVGGITQCETAFGPLDARAVACCKGRVERDIEESTPLVVVGVGDAVLAWATGLAAYAPTFRGRYILTKIGSHVCWFLPITHATWATGGKKGYGKSPHELAMEHDLQSLLDAMHDLPDPGPLYHSGDFDKGVEIITGTEPGDMQRLEKALDALAREERVGIDIETNAFRPWGDDPRIWTIAIGTFEHTVAFPLDHPRGWGSEVQRRKVWDLLGAFLIHSGIKEAHHLGMEMEWLKFFYGDQVIAMTPWDDTMSMAHSLDERPGIKSLDVQCRVNFGFFLKAQSNIDAGRIVEYDLRKVLRYNGMDAKWTNMLSRRLRPLLAAVPALEYQHYRKVRMAPTMVRMEALGLPTDLPYADEMGERLETSVDEIAQRVAKCKEVLAFERKHGTFSPTNSDHVLKLMKGLGRKEIERADRDGAVKFTTDEEALSAIPKKEVPSAALILEHRGVEKLLSTYIRPITTLRLISADGRIHGKYSSMTAVTGRLACEDPNLQNWPKRKHKEIRGVVAAAVRKILIAIDYGQIEFRCAGMASEDENLVKYCWTGYDVHKFWAERMVKVYPQIKDWIVDEFSVDWDKAGLKTLRQEAKNKWVFPSIFGAGLNSRAANLKLPSDIAQKLDKEFWDEFPGVKKWQNNLLKSYEKKLYVETLGGIRRRGPMSANEIINMPIQGTAAEIVTEAMIAVSELALMEDNNDLLPILNVHDDLTFEAEEANMTQTISTLAYEMCRHRFDYINVPLVVEVSTGPRWSELKEIAVYRSNELFSLRSPFK